MDRNRLVVTNDQHEHVVPVGGSLAFGRAEGPGQLTPIDRRISSRHGLIEVGDAGWAVTATGSYHGVTVYDNESPSRMCLPAGAGPVIVPFAWAVIAVEVQSDRYTLEVRGRGASGWSSGWATTARQLAHAEGDPLLSATVPVWSGTRWTDRRGRVLRWYQTLVAMCAPRFLVPPQERVPTNAELARKLGVKQSVVENHYLEQVRDRLGFNKFDDQTRRAAVVIAISQGVVTRNDLVVLELPGDD